MSFSIGIIGLPNVGKSTLFYALTKKKVDISNYPFCTIDPNVGLVPIPDERLEKIFHLTHSPKLTPAVVEFVDIAGLVKNAHQGEGLGNQFLAHIREVKAICQVVRVFQDEKITHLEGQPDPFRDIEIINTELIMKDLETVEKRLVKVKKQSKSGQSESLKELKNLEKIKKFLEEGKLLSNENLAHEEKELVKDLNLLTAKPMIYLFNLRQEEDFSPELKQAFPYSLGLNLKLEAEISELSPEEQKELELPPSQLPQLITLCSQILNLITFYTITGGKETRAWVTKINTPIPQAGGLIHSDFQEKFIRAEVINWQDLVKVGSWSEAKNKGLLKIVGQDYLVQDGDVVEFKI